MKKKQRRYLAENTHKTPEELARELGTSPAEVRRVLDEMGLGRKKAPAPASAGPAAARPEGRTELLWAGAAAALALLVRAAHFAASRSTPLADPAFVLDSTFYLECARALLKGDYLYAPSVTGSPLYPFFVAILLAVGDQLSLVRAAQILLDSGSAALVFLLALRLTGDRKSAFFGAALYALYGLAVFYSTLVLDTTLLVFLQLAAAWLILEAHRRSSVKLWLGAGAVVGLVLALKTNWLLFLPVFAVWAVLTPPRDRSAVKRLLPFLAGLALVLLPLAARNQAIEGRFSPFPTHGGLNFYIGNRAEATGQYARIEGISDEPIRQVRESVQRASLEAGRELSPAEASGFWFRKGAKFLVREPGQAAALWVRKVRLFWNVREAPSNTNFEFCRPYSAVLKLPLAGFGLLGPLALLGLFLAAKEGDFRSRLWALFVLTHMLTVVALFVTDRYRFPIVPFLAVFAASGAAALAAALRSREPARLGLCGSVLAVSLFVVHADLSAAGPASFSVDHNNLGNTLLDQGRFDEAIAEYRQAIEIQPGYAVAHFNLANAYDEKGDKAAASSEYLQALAIDPAYADARYNLALLDREAGRGPEAAAAFEEILRTNPYYAKAHYSLGNLRLQEGRLDEAIGCFRKAVEADPSYVNAYVNLGNAYRSKGDAPAAVSSYKKALELNPGHEKARAALESLGGA